MSVHSPVRRGATKLIARVDHLLDHAHGAPEGILGNHTDPLDEAVYIILSFQTDLARFKATWVKLRTAFPTWDDVERA